MCAKVKTMPAARCNSDLFTQLPRCSGYRRANAKTKGVRGAKVRTWLNSMPAIELKLIPLFIGRYNW